MDTLEYTKYLHNLGYNDYAYNTYSNINYRYNNDSIKTSPIESRTNNNLDEIIDFIKLSLNNEKSDADFYSLLLSQATYEEDREIIKSIIDDEKKHGNILRNIYKEMTGKNFTENRSSNVEENINRYYMNLKKALFGELEAIEKYRKIMAMMPDKEKYSNIMEIMTDEIRHAIKYNYLISKNRI